MLHGALGLDPPKAAKPKKAKAPKAQSPKPKAGVDPDRVRELSGEPVGDNHRKIQLRLIKTTRGYNREIHVFLTI